MGDSNALIGSREKTRRTFKMTDPEHTPTNMSEKIRIYNNSGETRESPIDKKQRIYVRARMYPGLSISRSMGDVLAHYIGVISEPGLYEYVLQNSDMFVAIGSDGIWDFLGPEEVTELINDYGAKEGGNSTQIISGKVKENCIADNATLDDMTLIISYFH